MIPFRGKAQSLSFLKAIGLNVPDWKVISHQEMISWGDREIWTELQGVVAEGLPKLIPLKAMAFAASIKIPEIIQLERMNRSWAIRSSAHFEDSPEHSFAGIYRSELGIPDDLTPSVRAVWASLYSEQALSYCSQRSIPWSKLGMDIILQEMAEGEKSGVLFQGEEVLINAGMGSGEKIISGQVTADLYVVAGSEIIETQLASPGAVLNQQELDQLMGAQLKIISHTQTPLDLEFTFKQGVLYFLQARPITVKPQWRLQPSQAIPGGISCSGGMAEGECLISPAPEEAVSGKILVVKEASLAIPYLLKGISGLILEEGSLLSHIGILTRELKIPALMKVKNATQVLRNGMKIQLNGDTGSITRL